MPENETIISFLEAKKLVKRFGSKKAVLALQNAIDTSKTGIIFLYRHAATKIVIKRYRNEKFVGILEGI